MDLEKRISELRSERREIEQAIQSLERFVRFSTAEVEGLEGRTIVRDAPGMSCADEKTFRRPPKTAFTLVSSWTNTLDTEEKN